MIGSSSIKRNFMSSRKKEANNGEILYYNANSFSIVLIGSVATYGIREADK